MAARKEPKKADGRKNGTGNKALADGRAPADVTPKQRRFVEEYLIDLNATAAAKRAGYSEKTARQTGQENLSKPVIAEAIAEAQADRSERTQIDADWVLERLAEEVTADLKDLYADDGTLKPIDQWPLIWRQGLVAGLDVDELLADGARLGQVTKVKLSDRLKRIELIGKHIGVKAFTERKELTGKDGGPVRFDHGRLITAEHYDKLIGSLPPDHSGEEA